jgi:two-component system response regulator AtoC
VSASPEPVRILVVDDDETFRRVLSSELSRRGFDVVTVASGAGAVEKATHGPTPDVILLDLRLPDMDGIEIIRELSRREVLAGVVVLTGHGTIDTAVEAVHLGAADYLEKPCPMEKVEMVVRRTHQQRRLLHRKQVLEDGYTPSVVGPEMVGESPSFRGVLRAVGRMAATDATVLVLGETGVGKEMIARLIHAQSPRRDRSFVIVDCAGLHEELLQSELFGHEKGAFTGAIRLKHGLFEVANGGSIFLDEVGDASPDIQAKLLRVLETGRFRRLGGTGETAVDVRVIAATNKDLRRAISRGHFREDLFFRLSTLTVEVPPLRSRPEDVRALVSQSLRRLNARYGSSKTLGDEARDVLTAYQWPGNVRELIHVLEQVVLLSEGDVIAADELPAHLRFPSEPVAAARTAEHIPLRDVERRHVLSVVRSVEGNRAEAADILQISERNLYRLLKKYETSDEGVN